MIRIWFVFLLIITTNGIAIASNIDSLIKTMDLKQPDTNTVNVLIDITQALRSNFPDSAKKYAEKALLFSNDLKFFKGANAAMYQFAVIHYYKGEYEKSLEYIDKNKNSIAENDSPISDLLAILVVEAAIYRDKGDYDKAIEIYDYCLNNTTPEENAKIWVVVSNSKSNIYKKQGRYGEALEICFEVLNVCENANLEANKATVLGSIGLIYKAQGDYDKALEYLQKVLDYAKTNGNNRRVGNVFSNMGNICLEQKDFSSALKKYKEALKIQVSIGDLTGEAITSLSLGRTYLDGFSDYDKAMDYAQKGLKINQKLGHKDGVLSTYLLIAEIYEFQKKSQEAIDIALKILSLLKETYNLGIEGQTYEILSENYEKLGNYKQAVIYLKKKQVVRDSIYSQKNLQMVEELTQEYESKQQEQTIFTQQLKLEKQEALLDRQAANRLLLIGIIIFLSALGLLSFYFIRQKQQANQQLKQLNEEVNAQNQELRMAQSRLKVANQDLQSFTRMASHDLKEPLRMMSSFASLLKRRNKNLDESSQEYIGFITDAANRMSRMINDMLSYATNNIQVENMENLDMNKVMATVQQNLHVAIEENNAKIIVDKQFPTIKGQASLIEQVFQNLISNAIKFQKPDATPKVQISTQTNGNQIIYIVKDNGIGIEPKNQANVFQLFKRFNQDYEGSGIGLTTCKKIIELHQGTIKLESEVGQGTTFILTFPKS